MKSSKFLEKLPQAEGAPCPPDGANGNAYAALWRFVSNNPPTLEDFKSHAAKGKPVFGDISPCRWASCSMFLAQNVTYGALPKVRKKFKYVAKVAITAKCGISQETGIHLDFWPFSTFKPTILDVIPL